MAVIDVGSGITGAVEKFTDWRNRAGERKVEMARLKADSQEGSLKDEVVTYAFVGSYILLMFAPPILDLLGVNGSTFADEVAAHANSLLEGAYGYIVGACALTAIGGDKVAKWRKAAKK